MKRLLALAALVFALTASTAYARLVLPDAGAPAPVPFDTNPWFVDANLTATVDLDGSVSLTDAAGVPVTQLAPGAYGFWIRDWSTAANFHLTGLGISAASSLAGTGYGAWRIVITPGSYRFFSDSAPASGGTFTVPGPLYRW
jgi:hypothetical protein